jgi:hypothetical protein
MEMNSEFTALHRLAFLEEIKKDFEIELDFTKSQFEKHLREPEVPYPVLNLLAAKMRTIMDDIEEVEERIKNVRLEILN